MQYEIALAGCIGGVGWGLLGYFRNLTTDKPESFSLSKFVKSVIIGAAVGTVMGLQGTVVDATTIEAFTISSAFYTPIVGVAEKVVSLIFGVGKKVANY